ncbi:hypothetical protein BGAL_0144g00160 [Botrytis galanthina]|uniref:Uncharacterized protein n=1 Tax=Botrytis galanthina TaxID=278940 RepID=A0A4S8R1Y8_9HELO|nr:hypothetical protein BGAL_0144g00160 [Botrytis galanthina]
MAGGWLMDWRNAMKKMEWLETRNVEKRRIKKRKLTVSLVLTKLATSICKVAPSPAGTSFGRMEFGL